MTRERSSNRRKRSRVKDLAPATTVAALPAFHSAWISLPRLELDERALVALKWLAVALMVVDHANKYLFDSSQAWMYALGRVCMPLFVFVLGYNLARPGALAAGAYGRVAARLLIFGVAATPAFCAINQLPGGWYPLNIFFTLLVAVLGAWMLDRGGRWPTIGACLVLAWGGALVEFWWPAVGACLAVWAYRRKPSMGALVSFVLCLALLWFINGNFWALAALPVIFASQWWSWRLPRARRFFYWFYPLHLWAFWGYLAWAG
jgi:hypothetical protein